MGWDGMARTIIVASDSLVEAGQLRGAEGLVVGTSYEVNLSTVSFTARNLADALPAPVVMTYDVLRDPSQQRIEDLGGLFVDLEEVAVISFGIHCLRHGQQRWEGAERAPKGIVESRWSLQESASVILAGSYHNQASNCLL